MYQEIAVGQLRPSPLNPRKTFDQAKLEELAASFAGAGVIEPLVVRANGAQGTYEVVAGERRRRAAILAKLETVPTVVRELSDTQVLEIMVVENNQREGVNPLEEAEGFAALLKTGYDLDQLAARLGRSKKYIYDRVKLRDLVPTAQQLLLDGKMTAGHGILLARLKPDDQARALDVDRGGLFEMDCAATADEEEAFENAIDQDDAPSAKKKGAPAYDPAALAAVKPRSVRELNHWIADHVRFNVAHAAQAAALEFGEVAERAAAAAAKPGRGKKVIPITFGHFIQPEARDEHERTYGPRSWKFADGKEHVDDYPRRRYVAKACEHAVLGVVAVGERYGQAFDVCIARDRCQVHWKEEIAEKTRNQKLRESGQEKKAKKNEEASEARYERQRQDREAQERRQRLVERKVIALALEKVTEVTPDILRLVLGKLVGGGDVDEGEFEKRFSLKPRYGEMKPAQLKSLSGRALVQAIVFCLLSDAAAYGGEDLHEIASLFKVDAKKVETEVLADEKKALAGADWSKNGLDDELRAHMAKDPRGLASFAGKRGLAFHVVKQRAKDLGLLESPAKPVQTSAAPKAKAKSKPKAKPAGKKKR